MIKKTYVLVPILCLILSACGGSGTSPSGETQAVNSAPIANNDSYVIGSSTDLDVLNNDTDTDGDSISITQVTQPTNGQVEILSSGQIQLNIDQDFVGRDQFNYTISDGNGAFASATVFLDLNPAAKRPVAVNDVATALVNEILTINVLLNDTDANDDSLSISDFATASHGLVEILGDGSIRYSPESGYVGSDEFSYTISDGALTSSATVTIVLTDGPTGGNNSPILMQDVFQVQFEATTVLDVLANDTDPDGDILQITEVQAVSHGSLIVAADNLSITYTPDANYTGPDSFIYLVSDGSQISATTVDLRINTLAQNLPPIALDDNYETLEQTVLQFTPFANDSDPDNNPISLSSTLTSSNATLTFDDKATPNNLSDDEYTYTPNAGFVGTDVIVYEISDGTDVDRGAVSIRVGNALATANLVRGSVHKGAVRNALINLYRADANGNAISSDVLATATSNVDGSFEVLVPTTETRLIAASTGGTFVDESSEIITQEERRLVNLNNSVILESYWIANQNHLSINAYTSAIIRKARKESRQTFALTLDNNIDFAKRAFGFNPFVTKPSEPLSPQASDSTQALQYALFLGGFSNVVNANSSRFSESVLSSEIIDATISDLADCIIDGKSFNQDILVNKATGSQLLPDETDLNIEIRRFKNNNFNIYPSTNASFDSVICQQDGTVQDITVPNITLQGDNPQVIEVGEAYIELNATAIDNVDGDISTSILINSSNVDTALVGMYTVTYDVDDSSGNAAVQLTRTINVVDTVGPVISLLGTDPVSIEAGTAYTDAGANVADVGDRSVIVTSNAATAVDTNTPGIYTVTFTSIDTSGNFTSATRTVNVLDTVFPILTLLGPNPQVIEAGTAYIELTATALDNIDGDISTNIVTDSLAVDTNTPGTYNVTYDVVDAAGNSAAQITRTVTVQDTTIPVITLNLPLAQVIEAGDAYVELGATALDNIDGDITVSIVIDSSAVDITTPGIYNVTYDVFDAAGNAGLQAIRRVIVQDTTIPVISLVGLNPQVIEAGTAYTELSATALDNNDGDISTSIVINSSAVDITTLGTYSVTYDVTDAAGNPAIQITRTVTVQDTTIPVISLVGENPQIIEAGTAYSELTATANDNIDGDISPSIVIDSSAVDTSVPGTYTVTYNVSDATGNPAVQISRTVTVQDTIIPVITLLGANPQTIELGATYSELNAMAVDNIDGEISASIIINTTTVDTSVVGTYSVTYDVVDSSANEAVQVSRIITVQSVMPPTVTLVGPSAIYLLNGVVLDAIDPGVQASAATGIDTITTNSAGIDTMVNTAAGSPNILIYTVTDNNGNINNSVTREIHVVSDAALADSDIDLISDEIENTFGSNPLVADSIVSVLDVNAMGDGSGTDWKNARTDLSDPILGSSDVAQTAYMLFAENSLLAASGPISNCNNLVVLGSVVLDPDTNKPAVRIAADTLPNSGFEFDPDLALVAINLPGCQNVKFVDFKVSGAKNNRGGAVNLTNGATIELVNVWLTENSATEFGGGINIEGTGTAVEIKESLISNNVIEQGTSLNNQGGGIHIGTGAEAFIIDTKISNNSLRSTNEDVSLFGAGIAIRDSGTQVQVIDSLLEGNIIDSTGNAISSGGAISVLNNARLDLDNIQILNNSIRGLESPFEESGGGIYTESAKLSVLNSILTGNQSIDSGGAIAGLNGVEIDIKHSIFSGNSVIGSGVTAGGSIAIQNATTSSISIINNLFIGNSARMGGAISQVTSTQLRISNNTMMYNEAMTQGGGFYASGGDINFFNNILKDNKSTIANSEDYFLTSTVTATLCTTNFFDNDPMNILCTNVIPSDTFGLSPIADRGYYLRSSGTNPARDSGLGDLVSAEVTGRTTDPETGVIDTGAVDIGYYYPGNTATDYGQNTRSGSASSVVISPTGSTVITAGEELSLVIRPLRADGINMAKGNSVFFKVDTASLPTGLALIAPTTTADFSTDPGFLPMLDRGDGTYEIRFSTTGPISGDLNIQVLSNPSILLPTDVPEIFTITIN